MLTVVDVHSIAASPSEVFRCIWEADLWPRITPHVKRIEFVDRDDRFQRFRMTVEANGRDHTVESERRSEPGRRVTYRQTRPPAFLTEHSGEWRLEEVPEGVRVHLTHRAVVDHAKAVAELPVETAEEADELIRRTLQMNGARTLVAIKKYLEGVP